MKFNPITNTLYTDTAMLIKTLYCPYVSLQWSNLSQINGSMERFCAICNNNVIDTSGYSDEALLKLLKKDPETCLKVDYNQKNIRIVHNV